MLNDSFESFVIGLYESFYNYRNNNAAGMKLEATCVLANALRKANNSSRHFLK